MTPREKAIELYNKFYDIAMHALSIQVRKYITKECALIAVDEILKTNPYKARNYWQEVKQEIEKL
jgi:hypothetical protein